jgi:methionyl-tRNA synthetase
MGARYLTTTIPYVNADPHLGFALEIIQADALARCWRVMGHDVFFSTGTDEHGQKILEAATKAGTSAQEYTDHFAARFRELKDLLNLSNDTFVRTTDESHIAAAQDMWRRCAAKGDIYKKTYSGLYCVGCEMFKTEKEIAEGNGHCPLHPHLGIQRVTEENYFFRLSKYQEYLLEYLRRPYSIIPEWRRAEAITFVESGLEDFSISREKARLSWGVPVPDDDTQVMYVWFDALTNYISTLGWPFDHGGAFKKYWEHGQTVQMAGKDQVRFQSIMWQAILASADIKATDTVFYHGFITSGGQKMSKSLGNVLSPVDLVQTYGTDAIRYVLLRHVSSFDDSDLTPEAIREQYTAHLTNGLGNLVARVMQLAETNLPGPVSLRPEDTTVEDAFTEKVEHFRFNEAMDLIFEHVAKGDAYMTEREPYKKIKSDDIALQEEARADIEKLVRHIAKIAAHLVPVLPHTAEVILDAVRTNRKPANLFPRL